MSVIYFYLSVLCVNYQCMNLDMSTFIYYIAVVFKD